MFNIQKHLRHVVLALGLAAASLTAGATVLPTYHIGVADTNVADIAYIDFVFGSIDGAAPVTASLSHFAGIPLSELDRQGAVSGTSGKFVIGNAGAYNDLFLAVSGPFAFNLNFSEGFLDFASTFGSNSVFSIALYDSDANVIGDPNGALNFSLSNTGVVVTSTSSLLSLTEVTAAAVPEPTDWMLMLTGLVFVVYMTRLNGRANARRLAAAQATVAREIAAA
jgi:hypothetical protein